MVIIGIDVSKDKLDCAWLRDLASGKMKGKVHPNTPAGHQALLDWACTNTGAPINGLQFIMEATGVYHEALAYALHGAGAQVHVVNPARIKQYAQSLGRRSKTDKKDSQVLARYGATHDVIPWQPEPPEVRRLKALIARLEAVKQDIQREQNRLEKALISAAAAEVVSSIETVLNHLTAEHARLQALIDEHIDQYPDLKQDRALLESVPGVGPVVSQQMLAVLRSRPFIKASQCAAFLGLVPIHRESGSSVRMRPVLSKAGDRAVRAKLYMAAVVATRHNPDIRAQYQRLLRNGKSKMSALCAAMRKLVHICFGVLKHQTPYQSQITNMVT